MPAHWLEWKAGQLTVQRYWQPKFDPDDSRTLEEWEDEISAAMKESVQAHKIADVEVGSFLSSGVDSSYMAALAHVDKTFTVGFANKQYDETDYAQEFSKHIGVKNYAYRITPEEYWANLGKIQYTWMSLWRMPLRSRCTLSTAKHPSRSKSACPARAPMNFSAGTTFIKSRLP